MLAGTCFDNFDSACLVWFSRFHLSRSHMIVNKYDVLKIVLGRPTGEFDPRGLTQVAESWNLDFMI